MTKTQRDLPTLDEKELALVAGGGNTEPLPMIVPKPVKPPRDPEPLPW